MKTPLCDAIRDLIENGFSRLHMPGHRGSLPSPLADAARFDITELPGLESLYENTGAIAETESLYTRLYGTKASLLSAGGSTLCIQAMLALACKPGDTLIATRGVHSAAVNAIALLDLRPEWLYPEQNSSSGLASPVTPEAVCGLLAKHPGAAAVYVTSPDYYGQMADIAGISEACRAYGKPLLVDNAHGAHLRFVSGNPHPAALGADLICDSLHKTLPVLTGGALLHIQNERFLPRAKRAMALFGSTSPSFLILLSADMLLPWLAADAPDALNRVCGQVSELKKLAVSRGFTVPQGAADPARLTLGFAPLGYTKAAFAAHLEAHRITPEYLDEAFCVLLPGVFVPEDDFSRLSGMIASALRLLPRKISVPPLVPAETALTPRQAMFAPSREIAAEDAAGKIAGATLAPCPPGVPLLIPGEKINAELISFLKSSGIFSLNVLQ